jgi:radical SAM superfamily enzyme YgiQ (UPF0313 family)
LHGKLPTANCKKDAFKEILDPIKEQEYFCPMYYEGPIYRPPSEADSLLVQATVGCPHNKCSFCMVYKKGPRFYIRPTTDIIADLEEAARLTGQKARSLFFPAGNSMAMPTKDLAQISRRARELFPKLERITVYASIPAIAAHGPEGLRELREAGLSRLHVGLETGDAKSLKSIKKGTDPEEQMLAGRMALEAGFDLSLYVLAGIAGKERSLEAARETAFVLNEINRAGSFTVRIRTLLPKINTLLLHQIKKGRFHLLNAHEVLMELQCLFENTKGPFDLHSDHYTNYLNLYGKIPQDREVILARIATALQRPLCTFREDFIGTQ